MLDYQIPKAARQEYEEGLRERRRGNCTQVILHLEKAIAAYEKYAEALDLLGDCFKQVGNLERAEACFKKAVLYSGTIYPSVNLAELYSQSKRFDEARAILQQALIKYPGEGDLHFALAVIQFDQGRVEQAEAEGLRAHEMVHRNADVHLLLSKVYLKLRKYPELEVQLETYLAENPKGPLVGQVQKTLSDLRKKGRTH